MPQAARSRHRTAATRGWMQVNSRLAPTTYVHRQGPHAAERRQHRTLRRRRMPQDGHSLGKEVIELRTGEVTKGIIAIRIGVFEETTAASIVLQQGRRWRGNWQRRKAQR